MPGTFRDYLVQPVVGQVISTGFENLLIMLGITITVQHLLRALSLVPSARNFYTR
jgi:hypothetical protein